ncbi:50S ribosomal protein L13 [Candidatus Pacearchaeota archaeon]|nr:50S ribosomal protein L13 [Candidatus Pacearchaeota archaeon]
MNQIIIDATNATLGRLASYAAKQALLGKSVIIVNCNEILITGNRDSIVKEYKEARGRGGSSLRGPHFPKSAERILKRIVRGMLPYTQGRGEAALHRVICHNNTPAEYESAKKIHAGKEKPVKTMKLGELSKLL